MRYTYQVYTLSIIFKSQAIQNILKYDIIMDIALLNTNFLLQYLIPFFPTLEVIKHNDMTRHYI